jgi:DNA replication protein DnaC
MSNELDVLRRRHREVFGDPTVGDAILDRLIHNAYRLDLKGESMRKVHSPLAITHD